MKLRSDEQCYVNSANLFKFCKEALNIKQNNEVKVIDQHVGAILGYDPADCSHWKKGKKNIRSIHTMDVIAKHLEMDSRSISEIVAGKTSPEECLSEYRGYGAFESKDHTSQNSAFVTQRNLSLSITQEIIKKADIRSYPIMIPEILSALPQITLLENPDPTARSVNSIKENNTFKIFTNFSDSSAHARYLVACEIGKILLFQGVTSDTSDTVINARINTFALLLLIPSPILQVATRDSLNTKDLIQQLSEFFWISRSLVVARLRDFFIFNN